MAIHRSSSLHLIVPHHEETTDAKRWSSLFSLLFPSVTVVKKTEELTNLQLNVIHQTSSMDRLPVIQSTESCSIRRVCSSTNIVSQILNPEAITVHYAEESAIHGNVHGEMSELHHVDSVNEPPTAVSDITTSESTSVNSSHKDSTCQESAFVRKCSISEVNPCAQKQVFNNGNSVLSKPNHCTHVFSDVCHNTPDIYDSDTASKLTTDRIYQLDCNTASIEGECEDSSKLECLPSHDPIFCSDLPDIEETENKDCSIYSEPSVDDPQADSTPLGEPVDMHQHSVENKPTVNANFNLDSDVSSEQRKVTLIEKAAANDPCHSKQDTNKEHSVNSEPPITQYPDKAPLELIDSNVSDAESTEESGPESQDSCDEDILPGSRRRRRLGPSEGSDAASMDTDDDEMYSEGYENAHSHYSDANDVEPIATLEADQPSNVLHCDVSSLAEELEVKVIVEDESVPEDEHPLDADRDVSNPAYIPRTGNYFMHDCREDESKEVDSPRKVEAKTSRSDDRMWRHDMFCKHEQAPRSTSELIHKYGYDIRQGDQSISEESTDPSIEPSLQLFNEDASQTSLLSVDKHSSYKEPTSPPPSSRHNSSKQLTTDYRGRNRDPLSRGGSRRPNRGRFTTSYGQHHRDNSDSAGYFDDHQTIHNHQLDETFNNRPSYVMKPNQTDRRVDVAPKRYSAIRQGTYSINNQPPYTEAYASPIKETHNTGNMQYGRSNAMASDFDRNFTRNLSNSSKPIYNRGKNNRYENHHMKNTGSTNSRQNPSFYSEVPASDIHESNSYYTEATPYYSHGLAHGQTQSDMNYGERRPLLGRQPSKQVDMRHPLGRIQTTACGQSIPANGMSGTGENWFLPPASAQSTYETPY